MRVGIRQVLWWAPMGCVLCAGAPAQETTSREPPASESRDLRTLEVERLIEKADADEDDWKTEKLSNACGRQLSSLAVLLERGAPITSASLEPLATPTAQSTPLRPWKLRDSQLPGGILVFRPLEPCSSEPSMGLAPTLSSLSARFGDTASNRHVKFKIIAVTLDSPNTCRTQTRVEMSMVHSGGVVQQTARWHIDWALGNEDAALPTIASVRLRSFEEVNTPATVYRDCTRSVLSDQTELVEQLSLGADYWFGKIDAVGERNNMGHNGIAIGDVNGDGLDDLYVAMGTGLPNKLLIQQPDGTVGDTAFEAGVAWLDDTKGVLLVDMDGDGDQDLLCAIGPTIVLCHNDGTGKFGRFVSMRAPTPASFYALAVADYDLDGHLDIYATRYVKLRYGVSIPMPFHDANNGPTNHLLRNRGDGTYVDVTASVGLDANNHRFSLAASWADYDNDGDPDLYVANDFGRNNLYRNDGGTFVDVAADTGSEDQAAGMGVSWSDFDLDGDLDLYVSNMFSSAGRRIAYQPRFKVGAEQSVRAELQRHSLGNTLLVNQGDGTFRDASDASGVRMGRWAWGAKFVDFNNDGSDDLVVPNGFLTNALEDDL